MIPYGVDRFHIAPLLPRRCPRRPPGIAIGILNIRDGRDFRLVQAIQMVERGGFNVILLMEKNIQTEAYSYNRLG